MMTEALVWDGVGQLSRIPERARQLYAEGGRARLEVVLALRSIAARDDARSRAVAAAIREGIDRAKLAQVRS